LGLEICFKSSLVYKGVDVLADDVNPGTDVTERGRGSASLSNNVGHAPSEGLDWAKPGGARGVMDGRPALAVLLVVQVQGYGLGLGEGSKRGGVGQDEAVLAENDILHTELFGSGPDIAPWHGIFPDSEQKEETDGDEVRGGSDERCVRSLIIRARPFNRCHRERQLRLRRRVLFLVTF
jgi:hypothetical protein